MQQEGGTWYRECGTTVGTQAPLSCVLCLSAPRLRPLPPLALQPHTHDEDNATTTATSQCTQPNGLGAYDVPLDDAPYLLISLHSGVHL